LSESAAHTYRTSRRRPERETRIPGLAPEKRVSKSAGPVGGNEALSRTPMTERTSRGSQWRRTVQGAATVLYCNPVCRALRGSTDAGGEDVGYLRAWKARVRIPPVTHALWRSPRKGRRAPRLRFVPTGNAGVDVTDTEIACSPAYPFNCRCSHGKAVVKMSVTSFETRRPQGQQQHRWFPANPVHDPW
jgi:hypothetical protein